MVNQLVIFFSNVSNSGQNQYIQVYYQSITDPEDMQISRIVLGLPDFLILRFWPTVPRVSGKTSFLDLLNSLTVQKRGISLTFIQEILLGDELWKNTAPLETFQFSFLRTLIFSQFSLTHKGLKWINQCLRSIFINEKQLSMHIIF